MNDQNSKHPDNDKKQSRNSETSDGVESSEYLDSSGPDEEDILHLETKSMTGAQGRDPETGTGFSGETDEDAGHAEPATISERIDPKNADAPDTDILEINTKQNIDKEAFSTVEFENISELRKAPAGFSDEDIQEVEAGNYQEDEDDENGLLFDEDFLDTDEPGDGEDKVGTETIGLDALLKDEAEDEVVDLRSSDIISRQSSDETLSMIEVEKQEEIVELGEKDVVAEDENGVLVEETGLSSEPELSSPYPEEEEEEIDAVFPDQLENRYLDIEEASLKMEDDEIFELEEELVFPEEKAIFSPGEDSGNDSASGTAGEKTASVTGFREEKKDEEKQDSRDREDHTAGPADPGFFSGQAVSELSKTVVIYEENDERTITGGEEDSHVMDMDEMVAGEGETPPIPEEEPEEGSLADDIEDLPVFSGEQEKAPAPEKIPHPEEEAKTMIATDMEDDEDILDLDDMIAGEEETPPIPEEEPEEGSLADDIEDLAVFSGEQEKAPAPEKIPHPEEEAKTMIATDMEDDEDILDLDDMIAGEEETPPIPEEEPEEGSLADDIEDLAVFSGEQEKAPAPEEIPHPEEEAKTMIATDMEDDEDILDLDDMIAGEEETPAVPAADAKDSSLEKEPDIPGISHFEYESFFDKEMENGLETAARALDEDMDWKEEKEKTPAAETPAFAEVLDELSGEEEDIIGLEELSENEETESEEIQALMEDEESIEEEGADRSGIQEDGYHEAPLFQDSGSEKKVFWDKPLFPDDKDTSQGVSGAEDELPGVFGGMPESEYTEEPIDIIDDLPVSDEEIPDLTGIDEIHEEDSAIQDDIFERLEKTGQMPEDDLSDILDSPKMGRGAESGLDAAIEMMEDYEPDEGDMEKEKALLGFMDLDMDDDIPGLETGAHGFTDNLKDASYKGSAAEKESLHKEKKRPDTDESSDQDMKNAESAQALRDIPDEIAVTRKMIEETLERVITRMFSEKIEKMILETIEKTITKEIQGIKENLLTDVIIED